MTRGCACRPGADNWCDFCDAAIGRAEVNALFAGAESDLDHMADAQAAQDFHGREPR